MTLYLVATDFHQNVSQNAYRGTAENGIKVLIKMFHAIKATPSFPCTPEAGLTLLDHQLANNAKTGLWI